jgi:hypothetical protein
MAAPKEKTLGDDLRFTSLPDEHGQSEYRVRLAWNMRRVESSCECRFRYIVYVTRRDASYMQGIVTSIMVGPKVKTL